MSKNEQSKFIRFEYDASDPEFENHCLVLRPKITIGPIYSLGFFKLFRAAVVHCLQTSVEDVCSKYFFDSPPSGEDKK